MIKGPREDFKINVLWFPANDGLICNVWTSRSPESLSKWAQEGNLAGWLFIIRQSAFFFKLLKAVLFLFRCGHSGSLYLIPVSLFSVRNRCYLSPSHSFAQSSHIHPSFTNPPSLTRFNAPVICSWVCFFFLSTEQKGSQQSSRPLVNGHMTTESAVSRKYLSLVKIYWGQLADIWGRRHTTVMSVIYWGNIFVHMSLILMMRAYFGLHQLSLSLSLSSLSRSCPRLSF